MRIFLLVAFAVILTGCASEPRSDVERMSGTLDLQENDATLNWSYPYTAPVDRAKRIREGIDMLLKERRGLPVSKFIEALGSPDMITDMRKGFVGMSMNEDAMLMQQRRHLSHRLVWYLKKHSTSGSNPDDIWVAAYVGNDSDGVLKVMRNRFD